MGDNDKSRRRAGDETRQRVDELAGGWSLPGRAGQVADPDASIEPESANGTPVPRKSSATPVSPAAGAPPPPPPARAKRASATPPPPPRSRSAPPSTPPPRAPAPPPSADATTRDVPRFDDTGLRAPSAADRPATDDEPRGDATRLDPPRRHEPGSPSRRGSLGTTGSIRALASLPRRRGLGGDLRYVATATLGVTRARRELTRLEVDLDGLRATRRKRLIDVAADALADDRLEHPALAAASDHLLAIEEQHAKEAGQVAAADARADAARRDHDIEKQRLEAEVIATDAELAALTTKLVPLEREAAAVRKRAAELASTLERIDGKIASTEARKVSIKGQREDGNASDAELAMLRADRITVARDEPAIAAELDELLPRIAELEARRVDAGDRVKRARADLIAITEELGERLRVVEASKKVIERTLAGTRAERDRALADLGERLALDRVPALAGPLRDVDDHELSIATGERRVMELREVLGSIHRGALARGIAGLVLIAATLAALAWLVLTRR